MIMSKYSVQKSSIDILTMSGIKPLIATKIKGKKFNLNESMLSTDKRAQVNSNFKTYTM